MSGLALAACGNRFGLFQPLHPGLPEHSMRYIHERFIRCYAGQHRGELALDLFAADRLAIPCAALLETHVVGVLRAHLTCGPAGRERLAAFRAGHHSPQREIGADILPRRRFGLLSQTLLNALKGFEADKALVLALAQRNVPFGLADVTGINWPREKKLHELVGQPCEARMHFQKTAHFGACLKAASREAFKGFLKDGRIRLVPHQHLALACLVFMAIAPACIERPVTVQYAATHTAFGLLRTLLALMLGHRHQHPFDKRGVGIVAKLHRRTFQNAARFLKLVP